MYEGIAKLGWTEADLVARKNGDESKLKLALKMRAATTIALKWIAPRLQMGTGRVCLRSSGGKDFVNMS